MAKVTVLGMGVMGSRMAISLINAGHEVIVWNRSLEKTKPIVQAGAEIAHTPRSAAEEAEYVISMVRDNEASKAIWLGENGALLGMQQKAIAIESSTLTVSWIKELNKQFQQQRISFIDAPVAGTRPQAEAAQLIYFVGGEPIVFEQAKPILQAMGSKVNYAGEIGKGMAIKLAVNSLFAIQVTAMGELIAMMRQSKIDLAQALEIIASTPVCSPAAAMAARAMDAEKFAPLFPIALANKDLNYAIATTEEKQTKLPLLSATQKLYAKAIKQGYGEDNITGIVQIY
ncbi:MAG: NAD(P)-dependent oxidoreductase [Cyanobacteria bacterium J06600_6]